MADLMTNNLAAFTPIKFSLTTIDLLYNETLYKNITNQKYEGTLKSSGDRVRVRTGHKISMSPYTNGLVLVKQNLNPVSEDLVIDQAQYFSFGVDDVDKIQNDISTINEYASIAKRDISEMLDNDILPYMRKNVGMSAKTTAATNDTSSAIGTAYSTGTVEVAVTTGVVTGSGTTFTAGMVGGYFKATGHTKFYLVTAFASTTEITIKDLDGVGYSGGAIAALSTYSINAAVAISLTKSNVYEYIVKVKTALDKALAPASNRFLVVNSDFEGILLQAPEFIPAVGDAYNDAVKGGKVGMISGFNVYRTELVDGNNTTGYWFVAGTKDFCSMAMQIDKVSVIPSEADPNSFTSTCKGLAVWGRKVFDGTRAYGAVLRGKF